ncbi:MAG: HD domain-containing protein [Rhodanobacteraceae bacterium]
MLSERLEAALSYARRAHAGQVRKGTAIPYIAHPMAVASLVLDHGGDEDQAIAALLHDVVEDCEPFADGVPHAVTIESRFGPRVATIVLACTDGTIESKAAERSAEGAEDRRAGWYARKRAYLQHLATASEDALLVSACDKLHNARAIRADLARIGPAVFERFNAGREGVLWHYRELANQFAMRGCPAAGELDREVGEIERLAAGA